MNTHMCEPEISYYHEKSLYDQYEKQSGSKYNRRCINGRVTGCGKCVGYCRFTGHPGFLTSRLREEHDCLNKQCYHYLPKPKRINIPKHICDEMSERLLMAAQSKAADMEWLRVLKATKENDEWILSYITISKEHSLNVIAEELIKEFGVDVRFTKLKYDFDICVQLLMTA